MNESQARTLISLTKTLIAKVDELSEQLKPADRLIDVRGICEILNLKKSEVYERISSGEIPARKICGKMQIPQSELQNILSTLN